MNNINGFFKKLKSEVTAIIGIVTIGWIVTTAINANKGIDTFKASIDNAEILAKGKQRFIVCNIDKKGKYNHTLLCDEVRKDDEKQTITAHCVETGEYYIFAYPCIVKDVTFTTDYIEYTRTH